MDKKSLLRKISKETNVKKKICDNIFTKVFELITKDLIDTKTVDVESLGVFKIKRNPMRIITDQNQTKIVIPPEDFVEFKPSYKLLEKIN